MLQPSIGGKEPGILLDQVKSNVKTSTAERMIQRRDELLKKGSGIKDFRGAKATSLLNAQKVQKNSADIKI
ncbi:MAG: hypothetical protein ABIA63_00570 [bacterium]